MAPRSGEGVGLGSNKSAKEKYAASSATALGIGPASLANGSRRIETRPACSRKKQKLPVLERSRMPAPASTGWASWRAIRIAKPVAAAALKRTSGSPVIRSHRRECAKPGGAVRSGKAERHPYLQTWSRIFRKYAARMQVRDGGDDAQSQTVAGGVPAAVDAEETLEYLFAQGGWHAMAIVAHREFHFAPHMAQRHLDCGLAGRM